MAQLYTSHWETLRADIPRLGYGIMRMPTKEGKIDVEASHRLIDHAMARGIRYYDTGYTYHGGDSELVLKGALAKYPRNSFYIADKLPSWMCDTADKPDTIFDDQLKKTGMEYFDFYLVHSLNGPAWETMKSIGVREKLLQWKKQGRIRSMGFSFHGGVEDFYRIVDEFDWEFAQIQTNYVDEKLLGAGLLYQRLCERDIPCIVMEPLRGGALAKLPPNAQAVLDEHDDGKISAAARALQWCMSRDNMKIILSGMNSIEQIDENVEVFRSAQPFTDAELQMMERVRDAFLATKSIPCTACRYCEDCPQQVRIPEVFETLNHYRLFESDVHFLGAYGLVPKEHNADACTACGHCLDHCPQFINIPRELGMIREKIAELSATT